VTTLYPARVLDLGVAAYEDVWRLQQELVAARQRDEIADTLVLVEHPHVVTLGRGARRENFPGETDMPVFEVERGGDVTYHGPGQLVGYPIFLLREPERDLHRYLRGLEEALILALGDLGVRAARRPGATGVWTAPDANEPQRKIGSIGIAVKRWVTMHGFALNVETDLSRFEAMNPCGFDARVMTSASRCLGRPVSLDEARPRVTRRLGETLGRNLFETSATTSTTTSTM
jgi:lipoate-protein ligase B